MTPPKKVNCGCCVERKQPPESSNSLLLVIFILLTTICGTGMYCTASNSQAPSEEVFPGISARTIGLALWGIGALVGIAGLVVLSTMETMKHYQKLYDRSASDDRNDDSGPLPPHMPFMI